jgi:alpha-ketoglutarate-dependent taurine dioxygenase
MAIEVTRLAPHFAARIDGVDIARPVDDPAWAEIRAAFEEHSVCSLLSARIVPPEGGATEFASGRAAYPSLPEALKRRVACRWRRAGR